MNRLAGAIKKCRATICTERHVNLPHQTDHLRFQYQSELWIYDIRISVFCQL
jgi:hypothetical protein